MESVGMQEPLQDGETRILDVSRRKIQKRPNGSLDVCLGTEPNEEWEWEQSTEVSVRVEERDERKRVIIESYE